MNALAYCIVNQSTAPELTPASLWDGSRDVQQAYDEDFAPIHGLLPVSISVASTPQPGARLIKIVDSDPSVPDAVAYHTVDAQGNPVLVVSVEAARSEGGSLLDQLWIAITHEIFETARNPFVAFCAISPKKAVPQMLEVCDPVQGGSYRKNETAISNFVTPAYFDANDTEGPYDKCGQLSEPFSCDPNGYIPWADGTQTFGALVSESRRRHAQEYSRAADGVPTMKAA